MRLRIPNGLFWSLVLALGVGGCGGDSSIPTSSSFQPGPTSMGNFALRLQVSNSNARSSTAANPSLGWAQSQQDGEVKIEVNVTENGGQTGGTIDDIEVNVRNANGRAIRTEKIPFQLNRVDAGGSVNVSYSLPRLNTNAEMIEVVARVTPDNGTTSSVSDEAVAPFPKTCANGDTNACLNDGRFKVTIDWKNGQGESGEGHKASQRDFRGEFWFFSPDNVDLIVDVLNGCSTNDHFWVFTAGTTNLELDLTVTDTVTGDSTVYSNPLNGFEPITDTSAFATCP